MQNRKIVVTLRENIIDQRPVMSKYKIIILIIAVLTAIPAKSQRLEAKLSHYTTEQGLVSDAIAQIIQDDYGYIWIATWNGLSRFDGYEFYNYKTGNASHIPNLHNRAMSMVTDQQQNIWMRMYDGRIFVLNRRRDVIMNPFINVHGSEEFRTSHSLFVMNNGDVLAAIDGVGLYKMRMENDKANVQLITTGSLNVTAIAEGYHDDIWVGTEKGLHRVDIGNLCIENKAMFEDEIITALYSNGYNIYIGCKSGSIYLYSYGQEPRQLRKSTNRRILDIYLDSHGLVWFTDSHIGANRLNVETNNEKHFEQRILSPDFDGEGGGFNEAMGILWVRMNQGGYGYYNRETDEVEYFHNDPSNSWNLSNNLNAVCELPEGVLFQSTTMRGLEKLEIIKNNITRTQLVPNPTSSMENEIRAMHYDEKRKVLLVGNKNSMLFIIKPDGSRITITHDSKGNSIGRVYGISQDAKGNIWMCSKDRGLFKLTFGSTLNNYTLQNFCHDDNDKYSINSDNAYQAVDDKDGNIWVATYGGGVNVLTRDKNGKHIFLHKDNEMRKYPHNSFYKVRTIARDAEGNIWAGTTDGILIMSLKDRKVTMEKLQNSKEFPDKILASNDIVYLKCGGKGNMWVGTNGGGLSYSDGKDSDGTWLFESFGSQDGLPSEEIKSIAFDSKNDVWFATSHALCFYNQEKKIFTSFSNLDGVDETMCSEGAAITLPNGKVLFGTVNGYYTVDQSRLLTDNTTTMKLRITDFFLDDQLVSPSRNDYYDYYVPESKQVALPHHSMSFAFRFAALNFQLQHRLHYQYMLEGYDKDWTNADRSRMAKYSDVPTGTYHFKVKCFLLGDPDKYDIKTITIKVPPYFLLSSNAIWLYMALIFLLCISYMFWYQKHLVKRQQSLKVLRLGPQEMAFTHEEDYDFVKSQLDWLEANFADPELRIEDMVTQSNLGRTAYYNQMKELTGQTPKEFISDFRFKKAIMFLENTNDSIVDVAIKTGFADPAYFARIFKQKTGLTPSKYREQHGKLAPKPQINEEFEEEEEKTDTFEVIED